MNTWTVVIFIAALALSAWGTETGMVLVNCRATRDGTSDFFNGDIRRIDMDNGVLRPPTAPIGYGCFPRFSPDGTRFTYIHRDTVKIATINGTVLRWWRAAVNTADDNHLSWTKSGIYIGATGKFIKYDTLGNFIRDYIFEECNWGFVSQCDTIGAGVHLCCYPVIYYFNTMTIKQVTDKGGCSACPSPSGAMISNNLWDPDPHQNFRVLDNRGRELYFFRLQEVLPVDESYYANILTWSGNGENWMVLPVGQGNGDEPQLTANTSPWIFNVITRESYQFANRTNDHWQPHDYYSGWIPSSTQPILQLSSTLLQFAADSGGTNPVAQTIVVSTPIGTLNGLLVSGKPQWLIVSPSATSGERITITNTPTIAGLAVGTYADTLTVSTSNAGSATYRVRLEVRRPAERQVLSHVELTPSEVTLAVGTTMKFLATSRDRSGGLMRGVTTIWSLTGEGTVKPDGQYTAGNTCGGPYRVIVAVTAGGVTKRDTAAVMVSTVGSLLRRINCGNNTYTVAGWEEDDGIVSGGTDINFASVADTTGIAGSASAPVYRSARRGNPHTYVFNELRPGPYTVRIHFFDTATSGHRLMSYTLQDRNILRGFEPAVAAGGANRPLVLDFETTVNSDGKLVLTCTSEGTDVLEGGIELIHSIRTPITVLSPSAGENYTIGQQMVIRWCVDSEQVNNAMISFSNDRGRSWCDITAEAITPEKKPQQWLQYVWTVPAQLCDKPTTGTSCIIKISTYNRLTGYSCGTFSIGNVSSRYQRASISEVQTVKMIKWKTLRLPMGTRAIIWAIHDATGAVLQSGERSLSPDCRNRDIELGKSNPLAGIQIISLQFLDGNRRLLIKETLKIPMLAEN